MNGKQAHTGPQLRFSKRPSVDDVRVVQGFENLTDQEAEQMLDDMELLCHLVLQARMSQSSRNAWRMAA